MKRPRALDLFCGAGGVSVGLHRAGFDVVGIDVRAMPRYPFLFIRADATNPPVDISLFHLVWASPPCQRHSNVWKGRDGERERYVDLIPATRELLAPHPMTVIENVPGAPLRANLALTGAHFDLPIVRTRLFECRGFAPPLALASPHRGSVGNGDLACVVGHGAQRAWNRARWCDLDPSHRAKLLARNSARSWAEAMGGTDWMTRAEMAQAIPPAYAEFIGRAALAAIGRRLAA